MRTATWAYELLLILCISIHSFAQTPVKLHFLAFSKTEGYRHQSIEAGKKAFAKMAQEKGFTIEFTEDASWFNEVSLKKYNAVIFLNTTGDVLNDEQQYAFERYIQAGGGYVGIHSATDTEYEWPWYNQLAGAQFLDHPSTPSNVQNGKFIVTERNSLTQHMPDQFERKDEFYSFKKIHPLVKVVLKIDEKSYIGGSNGANHPMSWYHEHDGGRAFYTAMGHTDESFSEPLFLDHVWAGITYASGGDKPKGVNFSKAKPEENRFSKVVLEERLDEPMELSVLDADRVLYIQRKGEVKLYKNSTKQTKTIATLGVSTKYKNKAGVESTAEDGLLGLTKDPNFAKNGYIYLYYSSLQGSYNVLSRFQMKGDNLSLESEKQIMQVDVQREECCHTGGSMTWDKQGNLYLSTGDNTNPHESNGYSPSDERPDRGPWDAQKSSANANDLRGKVLRIKIQENGNYTIPAGNLFPVGMEGTRPEIYTMGHRNPFRISVDQKTGYLYWGDVGPDASKPDSIRGPAGHDEVGQARKAGNFGWPHFIGNNKAYTKYDFETNKPIQEWDAKSPKNTSPNNTGIENLPPAENAFIWYPYGDSPEFPIVGSGGRNAMAGPVYYVEDFKNAKAAFPSYYNGKLFTYDWMRGWIMAVTMNERGDLKNIERFMPSHKFSNPMDMEFAENGDLYMLEYGTGWFVANDDARLIRIEYNSSNRKPIAQMALSSKGGAVPLNLNLSAEGSKDPDNDALTYTWTVSNGKAFTKTLTGAKANITLTNPAVYKVLLTVSDGKGGVITQEKQVVAGNDAPELTLDIVDGNKSFFFPNRKLDYKINVKDKEDGSLGNGIKEEHVSVNIDYLAEGYDKVAIAQGHRSADGNAEYAKALSLIEKSNCKSCHQTDKKSIGPSYKDVSLRYKDNKAALDLLSKKIINGGSGVWGQTAMAGHPNLSNADASEMVKYILSIGAERKKPANSLATSGSYDTRIGVGDKGKGVYIVRAAYQDLGTKGLPSLGSEKTFVLRNANVEIHSYDEYKDVNKMSFNNTNLALPAKSGSYIVLKDVDLNGLARLDVSAIAPKPQANLLGGKVVVRLDNARGKVIGTSEFLEASDAMSFTPKKLPIALTLPPDFDKKMHSLYLVFENEKDPVGTLMVLMGTEFIAANDKGPVISKDPPKSEGTYEGKWETTFFGTPQGDITSTVTIKNDGGKLSGTIQAKDTPAANLETVAIEGGKLIYTFTASGFNIKVSLAKENDDKLSGDMLGMFKVSAIRQK